MCATDSGLLTSLWPQPQPQPQQQQQQQHFAISICRKVKRIYCHKLKARQQQIAVLHKAPNSLLSHKVHEFKRRRIVPSSSWQLERAKLLRNRLPFLITQKHIECRRMLAICLSS